MLFSACTGNCSPSGIESFSAGTIKIDFSPFAVPPLNESTTEDISWALQQDNEHLEEECTMRIFADDIMKTDRSSDTKLLEFRRKVDSRKVLVEIAMARLEEERLAVEKEEEHMDEQNYHAPNDASKAVEGRCQVQESTVQLSDQADERPRQVQASTVQLSEQELDEQCKLRGFLDCNGFKSVNSRRWRYLKSSYPLHVAVEQNNEDIVRILLRSGANPEQSNSSGLTPRQMAERRNRHDSHAKVLAEFSQVCGQMTI